MNKIRQIHLKKALCLLWLLMAGFARAQTPAMNHPVTLTLNNTNLAVVLAEIDRQSDLTFSYDRASLSNVKLSSVNWKATPLKTVLDGLKQSSGILYDIVANTVAVKLGSKPAISPGKGTLRGRVVDFETSTPLPGATVQLEGIALGTITDSKGYYVLQQVPSGTLTLVVTFIGYQRSVVSHVKVEADKTVNYDIKMQVGGSLKEVVIGSGKRKLRAVTHSTEQQLLEEIKGATGVVSGISNELISKTADRNAAEIVKRVSGVTVVDDRFIVIRGMNERYNLTYLNGNIAPSTEIYTKAFAYDLLPGSVIDKILVYKSPVADLVADYAGAAVKVYTKNAMPVKHISIGIQAAYREGSSMTTVSSYNGGKYDFLGFDDGTRKLPSFSPGIFESNHRVSGRTTSEWLNGFSSTLAAGTRYSMPDMQVFGNYYNNWKIGKARLYDLTSITYSKETTVNDIYRQSGNTNATGISDIPGQEAGTENKIGQSKQTVETGKVNVLQNFTLKFNDRHQLALMNFFVNDGKRLTSESNAAPNTIKENYSNIPGALKKDMILSFQQRLLYSGNLNGTHKLGKNKQHELGWALGYTYDLQNIPDQRIIHFNGNSQNTVDADAWSPTGSNWSPASTFLGMIARLYIQNEEKVYNGNIDHTFHVKSNFYLKAGSYYLFKTRQMGRRFFRMNRAGLGETETAPQNNADPDQRWRFGNGVNNINLLYFRPQDLTKVWSSTYFPEDQTGLQMYDATSPVDAFVANEQYNAFYLMGDWKTANEKLTLNAGLRAEYDRQKLASAWKGASGEQSIESVNVDHRKTSFLPSVNISYRPASTVVLRSSYGRTMNRPDFREITPSNDFDFQREELIIGNPRVISAEIDNYDLRAEFYPRNRQEVFNVGAFYKYLKHPIEKMRNEATSKDYLDGYGFTNITFDNSVSAEIYGLEAEIKKSLSFIPGNLFRNLSLVLNGSIIKSTTKRRSKEGDFASDTLYKKGGPLQGQSPYIANAGLFYENVASGTKIGLVYNVSGPRIYAKSKRTAVDTLAVDGFYRPDLLQLPMHLLDISITQRLVRSLQVKFSIQNLLDQSYRVIEDQNYNQRYDKEMPFTNSSGKTYYKGDNIYTRYKPGRYILLQFTYSL